MQNKMVISKRHYLSKQMDCPEDDGLAQGLDFLTLRTGAPGSQLLIPCFLYHRGGVTERVEWTTYPDSRGPPSPPGTPWPPESPGTPRDPRDPQGPQRPQRPQGPQGTPMHTQGSPGTRTPQPCPSDPAIPSLLQGCAVRPIPSDHQRLPQELLANLFTFFSYHSRCVRN